MTAVTPRLLLVTAAIIPLDGRLFIAQRPPGKKFGLLWEFPGGKVELGETLQESLRREISEELCWGIQVGDLFRHIHHHYFDFSIELYAFWCTVCAGELCLREHIAYHWASPEELGSFSFTAADRELVSLLKKSPPPPLFKSGEL